MAVRLHSSFAVHPGPWLRRNFIEPHHLTVSGAADHLGVTRPAMSALLNGRAGLSATMALRFEKAFGISADTLMRMQAAYEMAQARTREGEIAVERIAKAA